MSAELSFFSFSFLSFLSLSSSFSLESKCSLQMCRSCCTFRTFPEPEGRAEGQDQQAEGPGPAPASPASSAQLTCIGADVHQRVGKAAERL